MLDSDLAKLYQTETRRINEAVSRNKEKFPERFCFRITDEEYRALMSHPATSKGGSRKGHTVFTEQGVAMLATILKTSVAVKVSISIMDAFIAMRRYISSNLIEQKYINNLVLEDHAKLKALETSFDKLEEKRKVNEIYFNGQIYDAYSKIYEILKSAHEKIIIIDSYADIATLDIIKKLQTKVTVITKPDNLLSKQDISRYQKQYHNLDIHYSNTFHDRYFIIDQKIVYHCGASINRIGYKTFSITQVNDREVCQLLIDKVSQLLPLWKSKT